MPTRPSNWPRPSVPRTQPGGPRLRDFSPRTRAGGSPTRSSSLSRTSRRGKSRRGLLSRHVGHVEATYAASPPAPYSILISLHHNRQEDASALPILAACLALRTLRVVAIETASKEKNGQN